mgnify:CR=1 FL=1
MSSEDQTNDRLSDILNRQFPGNTLLGSGEYIARISGEEACFCCQQKHDDTFWAIINSPWVDYIGLFPGSTQPYLIPYAEVYMCRKCAMKNINIIKLCDGCNCILNPGDLHEVDSKMNIYCRGCDTTERRIDFRDNGFFQVETYNYQRHQDIEENIDDWVALQKIPMDKNRQCPCIKNLLSRS